MTRLLPILAFGVTAFVLPPLAAAQSVTLDPGLYDVSTNFILGGSEISADESEYCVLAGENTKTFEELEAEIAGSADCTFSNISMTGAIGHADFVCLDTEMGFDVSGKMEATYGPDFFNVDTTAAIPIMGEILARTKIRRRGECPLNAASSDKSNLN